MNLRFWLSVAFLISRIGLFEAALQCQTAEYSIGGMFLRGHTFKASTVGCPAGCYSMCEEETTCQSYNFVISHKVCELNNRTKEARPEDFMPDPTRFYMKRSKNRVPLGSIQELPAESCSEIKASEGNEMVNGNYWLYSDGNGQTILARCEEHWQKINTERVCFGARDNQYGAFNMTKSGLLKTMKLVHKSGSIKCNPNYPASYWGCTNAGYGTNGLMTIITNAEGKVILPSAGELMKAKNGRDEKYFYTINGTHHTSPDLAYHDLPNPLSVSCDQEFQIWYGQDWVDWSEYNNNGTTCVDVYAWYA